LLHHVVWWVDTSVLEDHVASIFLSTLKREAA